MSYLLHRVIPPSHLFPSQWAIQGLDHPAPTTPQFQHHVHTPSAGLLLQVHLPHTIPGWVALLPLLQPAAIYQADPTLLQPAAIYQADPILLQFQE